jgi:predicted RNA-binding protein YlqC (UPF0109 family)
MEDYLRAILEPILTRKEDLVIGRSEDTGGTLLTISVSKYDVGRIIGKQGETIKAMRLLLHVFGMQQGIKISIKVLEPEGGRFAPRAAAPALTAN